MHVICNGCIQNSKNKLLHLLLVDDTSKSGIKVVQFRWFFVFNPELFSNLSVVFLPSELVSFNNYTSITTKIFIFINEQLQLNELLKCLFKCFYDYGYESVSYVHTFIFKRGLFHIYIREITF